MRYTIVGATLVLLTACDWVLGDPNACGLGQVPNELLKACVTLPVCDGGTVNARNECVSEMGDGGSGMLTSAQQKAGAGAAGAAGEVARRAAGNGGAGGRRGGTRQDDGEDAGMSIDTAVGGMSAPGPATPRCGNGVREGSEICDGSDCPSACKSDPMNACLSSKLDGSALTCDAHCVPEKIITCVAGDGCCPTGCDHGTDRDCSPSCGDGVVSTAQGETCEPGSTDRPCPSLSDCDDGDVCTMDLITGSAPQCNAQCAHVSLTRQPVTCDDDGDPCTDELPVESATSCAYECRTSTRRQPPAANCADSDPCTDDTPVMSSTSCEYLCPRPKITRAHNGDGCCPSGLLRRDDSDCTAECATPSDCGSSSECHLWQCSTGRCVSVPTPNTSCTGGVCSAEGLCKPVARCGDGVVTSPEECDPMSPGMGPWTCSSQCKKITAYTHCGAGWPECLDGTICSAQGMCVRPCSATADCDTIPGFPGLRVSCPAPRGNACVIGCESPSDCPPRATCNGGGFCEY